MREKVKNLRDSYSPEEKNSLLLELGWERKDIRLVKGGGFGVVPADGHRCFDNGEEIFYPRYVKYLPTYWRDGSVIGQHISWELTLAPERKRFSDVSNTETIGWMTPEEALYVFADCLRPVRVVGGVELNMTDALNASLEGGKKL